MITYSNIQRIDNLPFEEYLQLPGYSHSFLKREINGITEELRITDNIIIGKLVDNILTEPAKADMSSSLYPVAKLIAAEVTKHFGTMINSFQKQISYTAEVEFKGFTMPTTGRLDFLLPGHAVIDLKITKMKDINALIDFMGYKNQLWHYCKMAGVSKGYLMFYSIPLKQTFVRYVDCSFGTNEFWAEKIIKFGKVQEQAI